MIYNYDYQKFYEGLPQTSGSFMAQIANSLLW